MGGAELGVVLEDLGGELDLSLGLADELAHLEGEDGGVFVGVGAQLISGALEQGRALGERSLAPRKEGLVGAGDGGLDLLGRGRFKLLDNLSGVGVGSAISHGNPPRFSKY